MKKPQINEASSLADRGEMQYICQCSDDYQYYPFFIFHSQEPEVCPRTDSCGCSVEKSKSTGWQGKPVTPTGTNSTLQRAFINYGDKQHCTA